jgi:hypothetical protein
MEQPPEAANVYDIVYVPGVLVPRLMLPVESFSERPTTEVYCPPAVPDRVTGKLPAPTQKGVPAYEITAAGAAFTVRVVEVINAGQSLEAPTVYIMLYVPGTLEPRFTAPVRALIATPADEEKLPPVVPVTVAFTEPPFAQYGVPA